MSANSKAVIYAALAGNSLIAVTKFIAGSITGSSAMLSEGIHSLVDTGNQGLLLLGIKRAQRPPDVRFPFGYGKEIYFWSFVVAMLIFSIGAGVSLYEGVQHVMHPVTMRDPLVNYIVLGLAIVFEGASWAFALNEFRKAKGKWGYLEAVQRGKDPSLFMVVFEDSAALLGLLVALLGVSLSHWTANPLYDGVASIIIGLILAGTALWLAIETKGLLIGESANTRVVAGIQTLAREEPLIEDIHELLTMHMGPDYVLVNLSVRFDRQASARDIEFAIARLDKAIKAAFPTIKRIFIEAESYKGVDGPDH